MPGKKIAGKAGQAKGKVKQAAGRMTGKRSLTAKGTAQRARGKVKEKVG